MSVEYTGENQVAVNEESDVCVGDGTTCVECGKVFTHPFYFSTHISTHTNQRGFVVVGQCALCGLVFSNSAVFAAHLNSSQTRLETQVTPQDDNELMEDYSDSNAELTSQRDLHYGQNSSGFQKGRADKQGKKGNIPAPQASEATTQGIGNIDMATNEAKLSGKRKRSAPQRFEVDSGPQLFQIPSDADPEVEAYLLSLKEMGLTVDPAAFSSHRGGKRRRKGSESGFGKSKGKGRKELLWTGDVMDYSPDMQSPKKASPKYEYLDSDDSFEDDPEVLPVSGKLTRGERLQQRLERLSQSTEQGVAGATKKQSHGTLIKDEPGTLTEEDSGTLTKDEPGTLTKDEAGTLTKDDSGTLTKDEAGIKTAAAESGLMDSPHVANVPKVKLNTNTAAVKFAKPTPDPDFVVKKGIKSVPVSPSMRNLSRTPSTSNSGGKNIIHRSLPQPNLNTVRTPLVPQFVGKNNHNRTSTLPNMNSSNIYQAHSAGNARNMGQKAVRFPQGDVRMKKGDATRFPAPLNVQKSSSLEDLKKNSRENVEQMLQSVGMIAVTSSAMIQGKFFSSQKEKCGEISFPPVRSMGLSGMYRPSFPHRGFPNRPFRAPETMPSQQLLSYKGQSKFLPKQLAGKGQTVSQAALTNSHSIRGRQAANPHTFKDGPTTGQFSYPQSVGLGRGAGTLRGRGQLNNIRGAVKGSTVPLRGKTKSVASPVQSLNSGKASPVQKQTKTGQGSSEIIVIDDDEMKTGDSFGGKSQETATSGHINKGKVSILDVDLDSGISNIEVIKDKTHESPSVATLINIEDKDSLVQLTDQDGVNLQDFENDIESEFDSSNSVKNREDLIPDEAHGSQAANEDDTSISKNVEGNVNCNNNVTEETDIMAGEDIDGWKVCLAENSDSNEGLPSPANNVKTSSSKAHHLSLHGSLELGCSSSMEVELLPEAPKEDDSTHQCSTQDPENVEQVHSESVVTLAHCVSVAPEATVERHSVCELEDNAACDNSQDKACSERQDTHNEGAETRADHVVSTPRSPMISECEPENPKHDWSSSNDRSFTEDNLAGGDSLISENTNDSLLLSTNDKKETSTEKTADNAVTPVQPGLTLTSPNSPSKCVNDRSTENQETLLNPNGSCSLSLPNDRSVDSDYVNIRSDSFIERGPTEKETAREESFIQNEDTEKNLDVTLAPINESKIHKAKSSLRPASANSKASCSKEEASSLLSVSEKKGLETDKTDNGELHPDTETLCSMPSIGCSVVPTADNEECVNGAALPESTASQTPAAVPGNFLKDVSSLLDIFTEIEKTCKEMEETQNIEKEKQVMPCAEGNVKSVPSDIVDNKNGNIIKIVKVAECSNGMSSNEDEAKKGNIGDSKHSETIGVKEVMDDKSETNINENIEEIEEIENEHATDNCRKKNDMDIKTIESELPVTACDEEMRQASEED